jgi:hypothetical protein
LNLPEGSKKGDLFYFNGEPVRISAWNYYSDHGYFFDIEFLSILQNGVPAASMVNIPMGFDFYGITITKMSKLEEELF